MIIRYCFVKHEHVIRFYVCSLELENAEVRSLRILLKLCVFYFMSTQMKEVQKQQLAAYIYSRIQPRFIAHDTFSHVALVHMY